MVKLVAFQDFIVLGIIPGTDIQINFQLWLGIVLSLMIIWQLRRLLHSKLVAALQLRYFTHKLANELRRV